MITNKSQIRPRQLKIVLSNAEVLALPTTDIILVPGPGNFAYLVPLWADLVFHNAGDVTGIDATSTISIFSRGALGFPPYIQGGGRTDISDLLAAGAGDVESSVSLQSSARPTIDSPGISLDLPIKMTSSNTLDYTGGNVANTLTIYLNYQVVNI